MNIDAISSCNASKQARPTEDVDGPQDYAAFAAASQDPMHERHQEFLEWHGPFDPEEFDLDALTKVSRRKRSSGLEPITRQARVRGPDVTSTDRQ